LLDGQDKFVCFPPFSSDEADPALTCSDACALRDEFNQWEFHENVLNKLKNFWSEEFHRSTAFQVVFEDTHFLVVEGVYETKGRIFFYQQAFFLDIPIEKWREFWAEFTSDWSELFFRPYSTVQLTFVRKPEEIEIRKDIQSVFGYDAIELSMQEWHRFLQLQKAISIKR
jgi:hypothetical protein